MWQLNAKLICVRCSQNEESNPTLEDILLKPVDTLTPDMYGETATPEEIEYEKQECPDCFENFKDMYEEIAENLIQKV